MQRVTLWVALFGITVAVASAMAWSPADGEAANGPVAPSGYVLVNETGGTGSYDQPANQMQQARDSFVKGDRGAAAEHLQQAAALMRTDAARTSGRARSALLEAARDLDDYAGLVASGAVTAVDQLDIVLRRAGYALAQYHHVQAVESWARRATTETARELKAAADVVERTATWSGHKLEAASLAAVKEARLAAGKLLDGAGWTREEIGTAIGGVGSEIRKLGQAIKPQS